MSRCLAYCPQLTDIELEHRTCASKVSLYTKGVHRDVRDVSGKLLQLELNGPRRFEMENIDPNLIFMNKKTSYLLIQ
jgi:hypothetical protein